MITKRIQVECDNCGGTLDRLPWKIQSNKHHFCDVACRNGWQSKRMSGENNPAWTGTQEEVICKVCGNSFYKRPNEVQYRTKICSQDCATKYYVGENHSQYGIEKEKYAQVEFNCDYCSKLQSHYQSRYNNQKHHFCNIECRNNWLRQQVTEEDILIRKSRGAASIKKFRKLCLERDNQECVRCGADNDLQVHHILSFQKNPDLRFNLDNGITLCADCHKEFHSKYGKIKGTKENLLEFLSLQDITQIWSSTRGKFI